MQEITDYQIVTAKMTDTIERFGKTVDALIREGWQPFGAPFIILDQDWQQINQVMVKYAEEIIPSIPSEAHVWGVTPGPISLEGIKE